MPDLIEMSLAGPRALRAAVGFLGRLDDVEESVAGAAGRVEGTLDEVLARVRPLEAELTEIREAAQVLERRLLATEAKVTELDLTATELTLVAARLEGAVEHLLDKVPGLSSSAAVKRGRAVVAAVTGGDGPA